MKIILIRHGKPKIDTSGRVSSAGFGAWVSDYDRAGIDEENCPASSAIESAAACAFVVCSDLPRSIESARLLKTKKPDLISKKFRECEMPYGNWQYPTLSISAWSVIFRVLQLSGYSPNAESYKDIKARSKECAAQLADLARHHDSVLFTGHGALNWFLHKHLLNTGWAGPKKSAKKHWAFGEYTCDRKMSAPESRV